MIVKANQAQPREFKGVQFDLLAVGPQSMVTKMHYASANRVPEHSHPNEQSGYVGGDAGDDVEAQANGERD